MRIIYYSPHPTHDIVSEVGYATHQREVILALKNAGHEIVPIIMGGTDASNINHLSSENYKPSGIKLLVKKLIPKFLWTSMNNYKLLRHDKLAGSILEKEILSKRPDLLYERSEYLQDSGAKIAKKYNLQYFLEVNAPFVEEMGKFEGYSLLHNKAHSVEKFKLQQADKVFCVSSALADFLVIKYDCKRDKIIIQPNCINPDKIQTDNSAISALRTEWKVENKKVIGFVGSMFPYHGVDLLITAFNAIYKRFPDTKLVIVGDGLVLNDLKQLSVKLDLSNSVIFTGKIAHSEVFNYINAMDICIMARSNWYGSPVKLFEYGLMQKPIIAPDTEPVKDVIKDKVNGLIIQDNENSLIAAIEQLLIDTQLAKSIATQFHDKVIEQYTWNKAANKIIEQCV